MAVTKRRASALALSALALLAGCTADLKVRKISEDEFSVPGSTTPSHTYGPISGAFTYFLPQTSINVAVAVSLMQCDGRSAAPPTNKHLDPFDIKVKVVATPVPVSEPDPKHEYAIDYEKARTWLKETNFTVNTAPNRTFQGFNGSINDQSGPIAVAALQATVQIVGAALLPGVPRVGLRPQALVADNSPEHCNGDAQKALEAVQKSQETLAALRQKLADYRANTLTGDYTPGKDDPTAVWANAIAAVQSDIADTIAKKLTRTTVIKWTPEPDQLKLQDDFYVVWKQFPISSLVQKFLSDAGRTWYGKPNDPTCDKDCQSVWRAVHMPAALLIAVDPRTFFDSTQYNQRNPDSLTPDPMGHTVEEGLVLRDPATGFVQVCTVDSAIEPVRGPNDWTVPEDKVPCPIPNANAADTSPNSDDSSRMALNLPQLGRPRIYTAHSGVFENNTLGITLAADGTLQTASTRDQSTAAAGLAGLTSAASAAASAETARNTAASAANTGVINQIQFPATVNKALADCHTQAVSAIAGGLTPLPCISPQL
ncbi:MAG: hypothetical protein ISS15_21195 [Alphaproteobacteria bacterium]|nr:hypothetical protein [Reyranella sp.]MBL6940096.1 hypothetical protein [Alphaproteobacteria bacterium]MBL7100183.1 hypothetical protein [Alphaproteobacteria bacterium]